ncbi:hypothetical protein [Streptomyces sp. SID12501]|nr:hypothetical protein [Streptomyces sp. SID12501]
MPVDGEEFEVGRPDNSPGTHPFTWPADPDPTGEPVSEVPARPSR